VTPVNARRSLAILFSLALLAPWVAPADPCAPVCDCCPCCAAQTTPENPPCHADAPAPSPDARRNCTNCVKAAPTLPAGLVQTARIPTAPDGPSAILPPQPGSPTLASGGLTDLPTLPTPTPQRHNSLAARAPPFCA